MIIKLSKKEIEELTNEVYEHISDNDKDEMAIPSYTHSNPLIRWIMWKRLDMALTMSESDIDSVTLDFGCGIGVFLPSLANHFSKVYAIDLFPDFAMKLSEKLALKVCFKKSIEEIEDDSINVIFSTDVLEHVDDLEKIINTFWIKLKDGGELIISGPTENFVYEIGRLIAGFAGKGDYHHRNIDDIIKTIKNFKFELKKISTLPFGFPPYLFKVVKFAKNESLR